MQVKWLAHMLIAKWQSHWRGCFVLLCPRSSLSTLFVPEGYRLSHAMKMRRPWALVPDSSSQHSPHTISVLPSHLQINKFLTPFHKPGHSSSRTFKKKQTLRLQLLRAYLHWSVSKEPAPQKDPWDSKVRFVVLTGRWLSWCQALPLFWPCSFPY